MAQFKVSPATLEDIPHVARVSIAAFKGRPDSITYWMMPQDNDEAVYEWRLKAGIHRFNNEPECHLVKSVDNATGKIVGFALWQRPHLKRIAELAGEDDRSKSIENPFPAGMNVRLREEFEKATEQMRSRYVDVEKDYSEQCSSFHY